MATIFLISDTHFGHANVLTFCKPDGSKLRPEFSCVEEMDELMVQWWNERVRPQDHVYHLGDVAIKSSGLGICARLNGHKRLVRGNHDIFKTKLYLPYFKEIHGVRVIDRIVLSHIPLHPESVQRFKANVHGHIHGWRHLPLPYVNVTCEVLNYIPVSLEELKTKEGIK